MKPVGGR
jgi:quercetin dioxygenase-like cupin family protein